jgi:hypothetical protein
MAADNAAALAACVSIARPSPGQESPVGSRPAGPDARCSGSPVSCCAAMTRPVAPPRLRDPAAQSLSMNATSGVATRASPSFLAGQAAVEPSGAVPDRITTVTSAPAERAGGCVPGKAARGPETLLFCAGQVMEVDWLLAALAATCATGRISH